jgi:hypothetical protein
MLILGFCLRSIQHDSFTNLNLIKIATITNLNSPLDDIETIIQYALVIFKSFVHQS